MSLEKDISELLREGVIDVVTSERITAYYEKERKNPVQRQIMVFGILGALLAGTGIVLILAHNWDDLSKPVKLFFAALPLFIGQVLLVYTHIRKSNAAVWREGASIFTLFAIGTLISLVAQIYHIPGDIRSFLFTWILLGLPLVYLMKSSMVNLIAIAGITWYGSVVAYDYPSSFPVHYLWLLALTVPHYLQLIRQKSGSNFNRFHHWLYPVSLTILLPGLFDHSEEFVLLGYVFLFSIFYFISQFNGIESKRVRSNGYLVVGSLGTIISILVSSFGDIWRDIIRNLERSDLELFDAGILSLFVLFIVAAGLWLWKYRRTRQVEIRDLIFVLFALIYISSSLGWVVPVVASNLLLLGMSILIIKRGIDDDHLGILNYGLLCITALIICRFFDSDMSFIVRGVLFLLVGFSFFYVNYRVIQKRKLKGAGHE